MSDSDDLVGFEPDRIVETLIEHRVDFVLVGGAAAQFHGAQRLTQDADVVVEYGRENLICLCNALQELNWRLRVEGLSDTESLAIRGATALHPEVFERSMIQTFMTDAGSIDVLRVIPTATGEHPGRPYEALNAEATRHQILPGLVVKLASLDHIIESKQWANRPKDQEALPELVRLKRKQEIGVNSDDDPGS